MSPSYRKKVLLGAISVLVFSFFVSTLIFAGTTGKIRGTVLNEKTKETLSGVTVKLEGTTVGAISGEDGSFVIVNVPPGKYSITVTSVGYQAVTVKDVMVRTDATTDLNTLNLREEAVLIEKPIEVTAKRDILEVDVSSNQRTITSEQMQNMPVKNVEDILRYQVGFVTKNNELHVRGGRAGEALYIVDGVPTRDPLGGLGAVKGGMNVTSSAVEEISVLKGGFEPEYGNVQSAVINIVSKAGSSDKTSGYLEYLTDDFGYSRLNKYSFNTDRLEFSLNGPEPVLRNYVFPGLKKLGLDVGNQDITYFLSFDVYKTDTYVSPNESATPATKRIFPQNDYLRDLGDYLTGHILKPLGITSKYGWLSGFDIPDRVNNQYTTNLKLTWRATSTKKLTFSYKGEWNRYIVYFSPSYETRGGIDPWIYRYTPATLPLTKENKNVLSLIFSHNVGKNSFYEVKLSHFNYEYIQKPGDPYHPGGTYDPDEYPFSDEWERFTVADDVNANGRWDDAEAFEDLNRNGKYDLGEPFVDSDGDEKWNPAERFTNDSNGNGKYDPERSSQIMIDVPEAFLDGDVNLGEPFKDLNGNGVYDEKIDGFITDIGPENQDLNRNSRYDGPDDPWSPGVPYIDRNGNGRYDAPDKRYNPGESFNDRNGNGKWDYIDGFWEFPSHERRSYYQIRKSSLWTLKADYLSQLRKAHEIKTGFELEFNELSLGDLRYPYYVYDGLPFEEDPFPGRGVFKDFYTRNPIRGAVYFRDKLEYKTMIASLGLRYDFYIQDPNLKKIASEEETITGDSLLVTSRHKISPRLGVSYPIAERAKVYFNYGYFYQLPELHWMYARSTQASNAFGVIGNFNLDYQRTVQYELGIRYAISDIYTLDLSGYYKDIYGLLNTAQRGSGDNSIQYYDNIDYARARGMEVQIDKKYGNYIQGYLNYQYGFATSKSSEENSNYYARYNGVPLPIQEWPTDWDIRHQITLNTDIRIPAGVHPRLFGLRMPDKWGFNITWQYSSGFPYTPDARHPEIIFTPEALNPLPNSKRMPSTSSIDVVFDKDFSIWKLNYTFKFWVYNLLDKKNVIQVYGFTGRPDSNIQGEPGQVLPGKDIDQNPLYYNPGRNIRASIAVRF